MTKHKDSNTDRSKLGLILYKIAYFFAYLLLWLFFKIFFRFKISKDSKIRDLEGPILILANHQSFLDPLFALVAMGPKPLRFVVGHFLLYFSPLKGLMAYIRAIPIHQFSSDPRAVLDIFRAMRNNESVLVFPEGQRSINGKTLHYSPEIIKIAERAKANVITLKLSGAYIAWPRWLKYIFHSGLVEADLQILCTKEELAEKGYQAFTEKLSNRLDHNEAVWAKKRKTASSSTRTIRGLDQFLHRCPACDRPEALISTKRKLVCNHCGAEYKFNNRLQPRRVDKSDFSQVIFSDIPTWHEWQYGKEFTQVKRLLAKQGVTPIQDCKFQYIDSDTGRICQENRAGFYIRDHKLYLRSDQLGFLDKQGPISEDYLLPVNKKLGLMFNHGTYFQVTVGKDLLRIWPDNPYLVIRTVDYFLAQQDLDSL